MESLIIRKQKYSTVNIKPLKDLVDEGYDPYDQNHHIQVQRMLKIIGDFIDDVEGNNQILTITNMEKVIVEITNENPDYPTPFGLNYEAKGAYRQGKYIIVVGRLNPDTSIRIKYPAKDLKLTFI